ncbi:MAG: cupredoxin family copper-binding protein [Gemmatimonadaceae bacterium]|nr:cupredoxin family copper-binding protein [Gemmatimonadaceae bacterium]
MSAVNVMRGVRVARARLVLGASLAAVTIAIAGCLSERATGTGTDLTGCNAQLPSDAFGSTVVIIRDFTFIPAQVRVRPGMKVTWVNCGAQGTDAHTSTADAGTWKSPLLAPGATYTREFPAAGTFPYHCEPHPGMRGTVTVE